MELIEIDRLNERFLKDFGIKINPKMAYTDYFYDRLKKYELYKPGTLVKYEEFKKYILDNFTSMDEYYDERNAFIQAIISDQIKLQEEFGIRGSNLKEYDIPKYDFSSRSIYNMNNANKTLISVDLKSASFQALKFFNKELVRNCGTYSDYVKLFTDKKYFDNKRIRSTVFGRTSVRQIEKIEKYITEKFLKDVLSLQDKSTIVNFNNDEVVFEKTDKSLDVIENIKKTAKSMGIIVDIEQFTLYPLIGCKNGYVKDLVDLQTNEKRQELFDINPLYVPFAINALTNTKVQEEDTFFVDQDGLLCKIIDVPEISINLNKEIEIER